MMNKLYIALLFFIIVISVNAQTFQEQFKDLVTKKDTVAQLRLLQKWEKTNPDDPELFTSWFNYYATKSMKPLISLDKKQKGKQSFIAKDANDSVAFYLNESTRFDADALKSGFAYINKGIAKFPERLDMRFGKTFILGKIEDYDNFTKEVIKAIEFGQKINNQWTWTDNKPVEDPLNFMLASIQDYSVQLYNTNDDAQLPNMQKIAETVLKYYPDNIESLSNLSIVQMLNKEYDKAIATLTKAEKINPKDYIVLNNLAQAYRSKGDKANARKYYELTAKYGDNDVKEFVKQQLEKLNEKQ
ncbi:tetratricopeptide repeat protein [Flavobacterium sp. 3HN19-14]|uniref:tetratricopeptide repeat protein n=1 Tax=Flavobacterium sp. 3HN19-14 TaxID=3448133 RepID=UPI003EE2BE93